jgi:hypothetical protein
VVLGVVVLRGVILGAATMAASRGVVLRRVVLGGVVLGAAAGAAARGVVIRRMVLGRVVLGRVILGGMVLATFLAAALAAALAATLAATLAAALGLVILAGSCSRCTVGWLTDRLSVSMQGVIREVSVDHGTDCLDPFRMLLR